MPTTLSADDRKAMTPESAEAVFTSEVRLNTRTATITQAMPMSYTVTLPEDEDGPVVVPLVSFYMRTHPVEGEHEPESSVLTTLTPGHARAIAHALLEKAAEADALSAIGSHAIAEAEAVAEVVRMAS